MNRARTYHCTRMRHCIEQSNGLVPLLLCPSWVDCIIATRGYDFRKGQRHYSREDLEAARRAGEMLEIHVLGLASIALDVTPELARATIASVAVLGSLHASAAVKDALADRMQ